MSEQTPDQLSAKLRSWRPHVPVPRNFQREVWHRIAARQEAVEEGSISRAFERVFALFAKPAFGVALLVCSTAFGVSFGYMKAEERKAKTWQALEERYAMTINPVAKHVAKLEHHEP